MTDSNVKLPVLKVMSAWLATFLAGTWNVFASVPWEILAQFAAFLYTLALLVEWISKKLRNKKLRGDFHKNTDHGTI
ncbi:MAG: hypothetical protein ACK5LJ_04220 [Paracoccus sp. (in: a-proteobacteria)]